MQPHTQGTQSHTRQGTHYTRGTCDMHSHTRTKWHTEDTRHKQDTQAQSHTVSQCRTQPHDTRTQPQRGHFTHGHKRTGSVTQCHTGDTRTLTHTNIHTLTLSHSPQPRSAAASAPTLHHHQRRRRRPPAAANATNFSPAAPGARGEPLPPPVAPGLAPLPALTCARSNTGTTGTGPAALPGAPPPARAARARPP